MSHAFASLSRHRALVVVGAAVFAAAPLLTNAVLFTIRPPAVTFDGDPALDEMALMRAAHFQQLVGNYSRYGFSHPGPAWFYALDSVYVPLGSHSWSADVATLVLQAALVLLIVWLAWRAGGTPVAVFAALMMLAYTSIIGPELFRNFWPPFAVILAMPVLMLAAGLGAAGSTPALAGALVMGSYAAQTHVGTVPTVGAILATAIALQAVHEFVLRHIRGSRPTNPRFGAAMTSLGIIFAAVMWIPPLIDEVTGRPGNLSVLWTFFTSHGPQRNWRDSVSALGQNLDVFELHSLQFSGGADTATASSGHIIVALLFGALCIALIGAGTRAGNRFVQACGLILTASIFAITLSIRDVLGPVYEYLLLWVSTLPLVMLIAWSVLLVEWRPWDRWRFAGVLRTALPIAAASAILTLGVFETTVVNGLPGDPVNAPGVAALSGETISALASQPDQPVLLNLASPDMWTVAAGVGLQLLKSGHPVRVRPEWEFMFGSQARIRGDEEVEVTFVRRSDAAQFAADNVAATLVGDNQTYSVFVTQIHHSGSD